MNPTQQANPGSAAARAGSDSNAWRPFVIWPLLTGLAFGFIVGRELGGRGSDPAAEPAAIAAAVAPAPTAPAAPTAAAAAPAAAEVDTAKLAVGDSPTKGPAKAAVTIVAFSEFQCPYCSKVTPTLKQIEDTYKDKVRIAFKHLPLSFHQHAQLAAEAAMAAHEQGKFWQMHDKLFANQAALERLALEKYAAELGLNLGKFKAALDSGKFRARVQQDAAQGAAVGATGTPTFFINGKKVTGARPFDDFKRVIDGELDKRS